MDGDFNRLAGNAAIRRPRAGGTLAVGPGQGKAPTCRYVPAYVRSDPFCMARVRPEEKEQSNRLICVETSCAAADGEKMLDDKGEPLAKRQNIHRRLREYPADLEPAREMCAMLADCAPLEPFTLQATEPDGTPINLSGRYRVKEEKLEHLNAVWHMNPVNEKA
ncbi:MAG: SapC family protein [Burkholderiales bacterium]|nr:SapC family protein [Burkholderiales bacterium]